MNPSAERSCCGELLRGHGVASGQASDSPYPAGTIALQAPLFAAAGLDLGGFEPATLNLDFGPGEWRLRDAHHHFERLHWSDCHPPETFSFWRCRLRRWQAGGDPVAALIYYPHPETKQAHVQPSGVLEVLAPPQGAVLPGERFELLVDPLRCRLIQPARLRARLLEFLKFRVLAAQDTFFSGGLQELRLWLQQSWPEACDLSDVDLQRTLDQARILYTEASPPPRP